MLIDVRGSGKAEGKAGNLHFQSPIGRKCRYALPPQRAGRPALGTPGLRPPPAQDRLHVANGTIWLTLRRRWADVTMHLRFDPLELLERLAVLAPRPRVNLMLYYGVPAPRAAWRAALVAGIAHGVESSHAQPSVERDEDTGRGGPSRPGAYQWAELMQRTFGLDVLACPRCGGRLRLVALIEQASVVQRILRHLGLPAEVPEPPPPGATRTIRDTRRSILGLWRIRCHLARSSRPARRGVGASRRSRSRRVISVWISRRCGDNQPQTGPLSALSCRGRGRGGSERGRYANPRRP